MAATPSDSVTGDELVRHRLDELEKWRVDSSATVRSTERAVDMLKIEDATVKSLLVELRTEVRERDEHARASLARLHERLDEITTAESFEKGRAAGEKTAWKTTWKVIGFSVMATIAFGAFVVGVLTLVLH
jgi:hypothetical protein